jgi:phenylacetate-coenzyme A ligase PaaK-like adenylate-forming protein
MLESTEYVLKSIEMYNDDLADETSPPTAFANPQLVLEAHKLWIERLTNPHLTREFLAHASTTVPYYRSLFDGAVCDDLERFPIVDRTLHHPRRHEFLSTAFGDLPEDHLALFTNGTLGRILRVSLDLPTFFDLAQAAYLRFAGVVPEILAASISGEPTAFVISDSPHDRRFSIVMQGLNATVLRLLVVGRGAASDEALVRYLREARISVMHGKPAVLLQLIDLDRALGGGRIRPTAVVCSGENLYPDDRARLESWLGCQILAADAATETGMIALECETRAGLHVLADQLTVEVEGADGVTRPTGTGLLVVTNAMNWRHAFIRYRLGDRATVEEGTCRCGHEGQTIVDLPARDRVIYGSRDGPVTAEQISRALAGITAIKQYQIAPGPDDGIIVSWIAEAPDDAAAEDAAAQAIAARLGAQAPGLAFELRRVATINTPGRKARRFL